MSKLPYTPKPGTFSLFPNRYKEAGDNKPDFTGNGAALDGTPLQIAAWRKVGHSGEYLSVSISPPRQQQAPPPAAPQPPAQTEEDTWF
jgi:uncharacterized protein (DUF736 family)